MTTQIESLPSKEEAALARLSSRELAAYLEAHADTQLVAIVDRSGATHQIKLPGFF